MLNYIKSLWRSFSAFLEDEPPTIRSNTNIMATGTAKLTLASPEYTNPIVLPIASETLSLPITGDFKAVATSPAGSALTENVAISLTLEGLTIIENKTVTDFPIDIPTVVGPVIASIIKASDLTITLEASVA